MGPLLGGGRIRTLAALLTTPLMYLTLGLQIACLWLELLD